MLFKYSIHRTYELEIKVLFADVKSWIEMFVLARTRRCRNISVRLRRRSVVTSHRARRAAARRDTTRNYARVRSL